MPRTRLTDRRNWQFGQASLLQPRETEAEKCKRTDISIDEGQPSLAKVLSKREPITDRFARPTSAELDRSEGKTATEHDRIIKR